jgi:ABC-type transport system involved in multi-copper enzyme maturation permease subunit
VNNPVVQREWTGNLRTRRALVMLLGPAVACALLVVLRWPTEARVGLSGAQAQEMFRLFGYGLLGILLLLVPALPATSIVREKRQGTLALLLNSPMSPWAIYFGKLAGALSLVVLPLLMSFPAAAACYAMGGISFWNDLVALYAILLLATVHYAALGLWVSSCADTTDGALRASYAVVLLLAGIALVPHQFLQGTSQNWTVTGAEWLRCLSPISAVMEVLGQGDAMSHGLGSAGDVLIRHVLLSLGLTAFFVVGTAVRLKQTMLDRPRPQGKITEERSLWVRGFRRVVFVVDPQRRKRAIGWWANPVMVKEFRSRRFGRSHWLLRLVACCALVSLGLTYAATMGTLDWGVETIGGIMVMLQGALIVLLTPSLAAGLISSEHEGGGWTILRMTPLSVGAIVRGKLSSVMWPLVLILLATLPGYGVMIWIKPVLAQQISYVIVCLILAAIFSLMLSAATSSFFRRTAPATVTAYSILIGLYGGTFLVWLGRDAPFGQAVVRAALALNPLAAALTILEVPGFARYDLVPIAWWWTLGATALCLLVLVARIWRLTRPE